MKLIDLTHPLADGQPAFPGDPVPRIRPFATLAENGYNLTRFAMGSHQGTHLDAPFHFFRDGGTVDRIPLERLYGPATLVDLAPGGSLGKGATITLQMLQPFASAFEPGGRVVLRTGWDERFGSPEFFADYPSLTLEAARWIAGREIGLLGMDMPSPAVDPAEIHKILLGADVLLLEAVANLAALPERFTLAAFPLKLEGRDGAPVRAVAILDDAA